MRRHNRDFNTLYDYLLAKIYSSFLRGVIEGLFDVFQLKEQSFQWFRNIYILKILFFENEFNFWKEQKIIPIIHCNEFSSVPEWAN